jgi:hypothetical protein
MANDEGPALPPSWFEGGEPQSVKAPGDPDREILHELRNLNTGLNLLRVMFQQMLPVLEALEQLDDKLHHLRIPENEPVQVIQEPERSPDASDSGTELI